MSLEEKLVSDYRKLFWVKNYVKTITATTLVSTGIGLIVTANNAFGHHETGAEVELISGASCFILALVITFVLDRWSARKNKEMIKDIDNYIDERAEEIAEELVLKHLNEIANSKED